MSCTQQYSKQQIFDKNHCYRKQFPLLSTCVVNLFSSNGELLIETHMKSNTHKTRQKEHYQWGVGALLPCTHSRPHHLPLWKTVVFFRNRVGTGIVCLVLATLMLCQSHLPMISRFFLTSVHLCDVRTSGLHFACVLYQSSFVTSLSPLLPLHLHLYLFLFLCFLGLEKLWDATHSSKL